jgi:WD40 repeat protein
MKPLMSASDSLPPPPATAGGWRYVRTLLLIVIASSLVFACILGLNLRRTPLILKGHDGLIQCIVFAPDGKTVATGSDDGTARVWDPATAKQRLILEGHTGAVLAVAWSPDGKLVATAGRDGTVKVWNGTTGERRYNLRGHPTTPGFGRLPTTYALVFSPDGNILASGGADRKIRLWDTSNGKEGAAFAMGITEPLSLAFIPDTKMLACAGRDGTIKMINIYDNSIVDTLEGAEHGTIGWEFSCLTIAPDGKTLARNGFNPAITLWDLSTKKRRAEIVEDLGLQRPVTSLVFTADSTVLVGAVPNDSVRFWDVNTGERLSSGRIDVTCIAISPDGKTLAGGRPDATLGLWDMATLQQ